MRSGGMGAGRDNLERIMLDEAVEQKKASHLLHFASG